MAVTKHIPVVKRGDFRSSQSITRMNWPPDLNAIENVWAQLKRRIPRREQQAGYPAYGREVLIAIVQEQLELIDWETMDTSIEAMSGRIATVMKGKDRHTKY